MRSDRNYLQLSGHVFEYVRVLIRNIGMPVPTVKRGFGGLRFHQRGQAHAPKLTIMQYSRMKIFVRTRHLTLAFVIALCGLICAIDARAQTSQVQIKVVSLAPARALVDLELLTATNVLSFPNAYGGVLGLADRIENLEGNFDGRSIQVKKRAPGEYQAEMPVNRIRYEVRLAEPAQPAHMAHVSWLNKDQGLLMLADLLPRLPKGPGNSAATVSVELPNGWNVASNISGDNPKYLTSDPDNAVFLVGPSLRKKTRHIGATDFSVVTAGKWPVSDGDALKLAEKLIKEYSKVTGEILKTDAVLLLLPFPSEAGPERWAAETRGNAVVLLLGSQASRKKVLTKLGVVLSHEIFHLWVPNALALEGNYDWFFEGFTLYQALRMDLRLKLISFDTFLETIARVYDAYVSSADLDSLSLIEASERRWTTASSLVYDKGLLAAFIYDLTVRNATDCRHSLDDVYRELFRRRTGQGSANETIIRILNEPPRMNTFGRDYVEAKGEIDLHSALTSYGLQLRPGLRGQATRLELANNLNEKQRAALRCIGYRD